MLAVSLEASIWISVLVWMFLAWMIFSETFRYMVFLLLFVTLMIGSVALPIYLLT